MSIAPSSSIYSQPKGLYFLFSTELWERFGYYTVQAILILYLTKALGYTDSKANMIYACYSALLYLTPVLGGYVADRYLGFQQAILIGGIISAIGYFVLTVPNDYIFFIGLSILISANGLFKPNISSIVGELYTENDPRREGGFTLFYMGINIGALVPPLIAEYIAHHYGWHSSFLLAALGMLTAFIIFIAGRSRLKSIGKTPSSKFLSERRMPTTWLFQVLFYISFLIITVLCMLAFRHPETTTHIVEIGGVLTVLAVILVTFRENKINRKKILACLILTIISVGFWALYNQTFTSLTLFADRNMVQHLFGIPLDAAAMQFFNPLFIILLSPLLSGLWVSLSRRQANPSIPAKFALGVVFIAAGFLLLPIGTNFFAHGNLVSPWWLIFSYFMQTIGELLLSPIGLAMVTLLVPKNLTGMMMGVWFFAQAASFALGGTLANLAAIPENISPSASLPIYNHAFLLFGVLSVFLAVVSFLLLPVLRSLIVNKAAA